MFWCFAWISVWKNIFNHPTLYINMFCQPDFSGHVTIIYTRAIFCPGCLLSPGFPSVRSSLLSEIYTSEICGVLKNTVHEEYFGWKRGDIRTIVFVNIKWPWHFASGVSFSSLQCTNFNMSVLWRFSLFTVSIFRKKINGERNSCFAVSLFSTVRKF